MPGFLYFVPGVNSVSSIAQLAEWGIAHAFDNPGRKTPQPSAGPDNLSGLLLSDPRRVDPGRASYAPTRQIWRKHAKGYYVGMEKGVPITPADLRRPSPIAGVDLQLGDGNSWQVPVARAWTAHEDQLRYRILLEQGIDYLDGQVVYRSVVKRHAELWAIATAWYHHLAGPDDVEMDPEEERELLFGSDSLSDVQLYGCAARVLGANYAIGLLEAIMLGLFTSSNWQLILNALIDWDTYVELVQKKRAQLLAAHSSSTGPGGTPPSTDPPSPTSSPSAKDTT